MKGCVTRVFIGNQVWSELWSCHSIFMKMNLVQRPIHTDLTMIAISLIPRCPSFSLPCNRNKRRSRLVMILRYSPGQYVNTLQKLPIPEFIYHINHFSCHKVLNIKHFKRSAWKVFPIWAAFLGVLSHRSTNTGSRKSMMEKYGRRGLGKRSPHLTMETLS